MLVLTLEDFVSGNLSGKHRLAVESRGTITHIMYLEFALFLKMKKLVRNI
jgi:hypothetical protein